MDIVCMVGSHPRHRYIAERAAEGGDLVGLIIEERGEHTPDPPDGLGAELSELYTHHFERRAAAENEFFSDASFPDANTIRVPQEELNSEEVRDFISEADPGVAITYGVHILSPKTLDTVPELAWNVHGGLSPEYRGVITHFWPSYMLEPQMTGVTLHELTPTVDAGPIVHQTGGQLVKGDGIHQLASRTVRKFGDELPKVISKAAANDLEDPVPQRGSGKLWTASDWRPEHLRVVYEYFNNEIVDRYIEGEIEGEEPDLVRQVE
ncbi:methionyl-tRNA formyltransferase [Salinibacter ruber]|uniref:formyltransferase family protein n=1 Tax=Salinibacter ruber TaxID=146919 RepID=UPI0021686579|nr:formyltransferase family protein [Salinibacter ruber]MCS3632511.1 methionyl-tRNA formyltransferase [Salinibacter ruber]